MESSYDQDSRSSITFGTVVQCIAYCSRWISHHKLADIIMVCPYDGPISDIETKNNVVAPESHLQLSEQQLQELERNVDSISVDGNNGTDHFVNPVRIIEGFTSWTSWNSPPPSSPSSADVIPISCPVAFQAAHISWRRKQTSSLSYNTSTSSQFTFCYFVVWSSVLVWSSGIDHFQFRKGISPAEFQNLQDGYAEITSESRYTQQTKALR